MEEAGLEVELDGIYRIEYKAYPKSVRFRVIWAAHQLDETCPLKTVADSETYGAEWFTVKELMGIAQKSPDMLENLANIPRIKEQKEKGIRKAKEKIRSTEMINMFNWAEKGTKIFNSRLYYGEDGDEINSKIVRVNTFYKIVVVIRNRSDNGGLAVRSLNLSKTFRSFHEEAEKLLKSIGTQNSKQVCKLKLENFCGLHHLAPKTESGNGNMTVCFLATAEYSKKKKNPMSFFNDSEELEKVLNDCSPEEEYALNNVKDGILAPINMLTEENSPHIVLE